MTGETHPVETEPKGGAVGSYPVCPSSWWYSVHEPVDAASLTCGRFWVDGLAGVRKRASPSRRARAVLVRTLTLKTLRPNAFLLVNDAWQRVGRVRDQDPGTLVRHRAESGPRANR